MYAAFHQLGIQWRGDESDS